MKMKLLEVLSVVLVSAVAVTQGANMSNRVAEPREPGAAAVVSAALSKDQTVSKEQAARIGCIVINEITCAKSYQARFEKLFKSRVHAIDGSPGFVAMRVLQDSKKPLSYLVMTLWESEETFLAWTKSEEFRDGHKRVFKDVAEATKDGGAPPLVASESRTYKVIAD
ncbi:MAG: antibiotic biosynthesis monooxygenase [Armatimonadetes bacterium]|nr:antibiotic biosynthesis monooxygenase [Armatimonadota bacterium]